MPVLTAQKISKAYGDVPILSGVSVTLRSAERVGLVGNNGSGKSTLGRILAGAEVADTGRLACRRGARVDYLPQEPALPPSLTVRQVVLDSLEEWSEAKCRHEAVTAELGEASADVERLVSLQARAAEAVERLGGWERLHEAEAMLGNLGVDDPDRLVSHLSGGERRRVALASVLVRAPDLAILDEPTNHLDVAAIEWLEEYLKSRFAGSLLLITHDRYLLDRVTTRTLELHAGTLASYDGGYARYLEAKALREAHTERVERNRQNFLRRELEWLRRQPKARSTKQKARLGRAQDAVDARGPQREKTAELRAHTPRLGKIVLEVSGLRIERGGRALIDGLDLALSPGQRLGIIGANGTGKTSLLLCLQDQLAATRGEIRLGKNTCIGYLDQAREHLDDHLSVRECVAGDRGEIEVGDESLQVVSYLERFLFDRAAQRSRVSELSGGERARVCLARLLSQQTNLLLLDEPTNDLDVATLAALESMLADYGGCALIVSHDRWFLDRVVTSILAFEGDGRVSLHAGNFSEYRERVAASARTTAPATPKAAVPKAAVRRQRPGKLSFGERRELDGLFEKIEAAEEVVATLEARLSDPALYKNAGASVAQLQRDLEASRAHVATLTARWEELEERRTALED